MLNANVFDSRLVDLSTNHTVKSTVLKSRLFGGQRAGRMKSDVSASVMGVTCYYFYK